MSKDGGPAFPAQPIMHYPDGTSMVTNQGGMSLRDYFAGQALDIAAEAEANSPTGPNGVQSYEGAARRAYRYADAMLKARSDV